MIECIFTIDYEIYGNGEGSLRELVYEPAENLRTIFKKWNARFVVFVEVAELEMIEAECADPDIDLVKASPLWYSLPEAGGQVIHDDHGMSVRQQLSTAYRADVSRAACDQNVCH